jgi:hypothetical protein
VNLAFKISAAATPLGSTLLTLTKDDLESGSGFRVELAGIGSGRIVMNRNRPEVTEANFAQDNYVRVYDTDISSTIPLGGFFLDDRQIQILSLDEEGGEAIQFGGPGALSYFGRGILWNINYVSFGDDAHYGPRSDGLWYWYNDQYGDILKRMIDEAQDSDRPAEGHVIDDLTYDFNSSTDSAGDGWDSFTGNFSLPAGTNYLDIVQRFRDVGLTIQVSGDLLMQAYQGFYGTDRHSASFADGKIRFVNVDGAAGANIVEELARQSRPSLQLSRVLVKGDSGEPATMRAVDAASYNVAREGFVDYPSSHAPDTLDAVGEQALQLRSDSSDVPNFRHIPGCDPIAGLYSPFPETVIVEVGTDLLLGLSNSHLKASKTQGVSQKRYAIDGDLTTRWTPPAGYGPCAGHWWAADRLTAADAAAFRYYLEPGHEDDWATAGNVYGSNDAAAWAWLVNGSEHMVDDPEDNGWALLGGWSGAASPDTGVIALDSPGSYRYYLVLATDGGLGSNNEFDISAIQITGPTAGVEGCHYWLGDLVTLHTGTEMGDYNEVTLRVYAINWELDDDEWWPRPELGGLLQLAMDTTPSATPAGSGGSSGGVVTVTSPSTPPASLRKELLNKSGGLVEHGDVVVIDADNDEAFETTTVAAETRVVGIAQEDIAADARGWVLLAGYAEIVNTVASVTRGHYGFTSTTAKQASGATPRASGAFCQFLKGGTEPSAILFGEPDSGGGGAGHTIQEDATPLTARSGLNFGEGIVATDDAGNNRTNVNLDWAEDADVSTQAFGDAAATGSSVEVARAGHKHAMPADPVTAHAAASDPHTGYVLESLPSAKGEVFGASANDTPAMIAASTEGQVLVGRAAETAGNKFETQYAQLGVTIGNGVNVLTTGVKGYKRVPFACEIVRASLGSDISGSVVVDIWVDTHANFPPTVADTITASAKPTLSSATKYEDTTLTGWTKTLAEGSWIGFNIDSATSIKQLEVELRVKRT